MSNILDECELGTLKGMAIYWQEVFERDEPERQYIVGSELAKVIRFIRPEKVLRIITEHVRRS